jgi:hypothetical protein
MVHRKKQGNGKKAIGTFGHIAERSAFKIHRKAIDRSSHARNTIDASA